MMRHARLTALMLTTLSTTPWVWAQDVHADDAAVATPPAAGPHAPVAGPDAPPPPSSTDEPAFTLSPDAISPLERAGSIDALFALARIKQETGEHEAALEIWQRALDEVEERHGRWHARNVTALAGIAEAHRDLQQYQQAIEHFGQAVYINRMNEGLHDPSQLAYLDEIAEIHAERSEWQEAVQLQEYAYYVHQREHGQDTPEVLPALFRMAEWYQRVGALLSARYLYEQAVAIIETHFGEDDVRLVQPLQMLAMTYRFERYPTAITPRRDDAAFRVSTGGPAPESDIYLAQRQTLNPYSVGERALERSVQLQLDRPDLPVRERAESLIGLADWYLLFDKWNQAMETYGQVHELLRAGGWDEAQVGAAFAEPVALEFPIPAAPTPPPWSEGIRRREGYVDLIYDVTERGRLRNLDITAAEPEGLLDFRLRRAVRAARFRPRFEDGSPVASAGVTYRHRYVYYTEPVAPTEPANPDASSDAPLQETAQSSGP